MPGRGGPRSPSTARPSGIPVPVSSTRRPPCGRWWGRRSATAPRSSPAGPVAQVEATATGYRLKTGDGRTLDAERVVVTAGGWLPALLNRLPLPSSFRALVPPLQVSQENAFHFPYREGIDLLADLHPQEPHHLDLWPARWPRRRIPRTEDRRVPRRAKDRLGCRPGRGRRPGEPHPHRQLRPAVPAGPAPEPYAETTCLFTSTPNEDFLVDGTDGITLVSPCSGHGAKFAPLIGDIAADVATGEGRAPDRFTVRALDAAGRAIARFDD